MRWLLAAGWPRPHAWLAKQVWTLYGCTVLLDELMVYSKSLELKESKYEASWMEDTIRSICAFNLEKG